METIRIEPGIEVQCDMCSKDFTDSDEWGGIYGFGSKAIGPCCSSRMLAEAKKFGELGAVKARCPLGKSFADWVRQDLR